jgi:LAO/AO transport system kinase
MTRDAAETARAVTAGDPRAAARLMRDLDDRVPGALEVLRELYPHTGRAHIVGVTGNPGCGKSTLVDVLIKRYRAAGQRVGVVAVDPSSPFSGGAILGDRIRMQRHALDDGVFIRSLATRGHLGGLSRSTDDVVTVLDAMGFELVVVETVGVGQAEVEVVGTAQLAVVVVVPGLGDELQAMKAGVLEIADVLCVNKADRPGAERAVQDLEQMLALRAPGGAAPKPRPPIVSTVAVSGQGVAELAAAIDVRLGRQRESGELAAWRRARARRQLEESLRERLCRAALERLGEDELAARLEAVARRDLDPYSLADEVAALVLGG